MRVWQMHCRLELTHPPAFDLGRIGRDPFHRLLERTWMIQQVPIAAVLYLAGGWGFVVWGVCARVTASVVGHWFVGHLAHRRGPQTWLVDGAGVQAHDVPWAAIPTMGEAWHNNHHAFPGSARIGLYAGQADWGFRFIQLLERLGLAWDVRTAGDLGVRPLTAASAARREDGADRRVEHGVGAGADVVIGRLDRDVGDDADLFDDGAGAGAQAAETNRQLAAVGQAIAARGHHRSGRGLAHDRAAPALAEGGGDHLGRAGGMA
jgi:hypothetical protein